MSREAHVQCCEQRWGKFLALTHLIITGCSKEVLEKKVTPVVANFLKERGLKLSPSKTTISHISDGFDFLGMTIRKFNGKLIIKPSKESIKTFLRNIRNLIKTKATSKTEKLIYLLNPKISGWTNYYQHVCAKRTFNYIDNALYNSLWQWAKRRHPNKNATWIKKKYFHNITLRQWVFGVSLNTAEYKGKFISLKEAKKTPIVRHVKIRALANPFCKDYFEYLNKRKTRYKTKDNHDSYSHEWHGRSDFTLNRA